MLITGVAWAGYISGQFLPICSFSLPVSFKNPPEATESKT